MIIQIEIREKMSLEPHWINSNNYVDLLVPAQGRYYVAGDSVYQHADGSFLRIKNEKCVLYGRVIQIGPTMDGYQLLKVMRPGLTHSRREN
jgi:hypothetical protein